MEHVLPRELRRIGPLSSYPSLVVLQSLRRALPLRYGLHRPRHRSPLRLRRLLPGLRCTLHRLPLHIHSLLHPIHLREVHLRLVV